LPLKVGKLSKLTPTTPNPVCQLTAASAVINKSVYFCLMALSAQTGHIVP